MLEVHCIRERAVCLTGFSHAHDGSTAHYLTPCDVTICSPPAYWRTNVLAYGTYASMVRVRSRLFSTTELFRSSCADAAYLCRLVPAIHMQDLCTRADCERDSWRRCGGAAIQGHLALINAVCRSPAQLRQEG